MMRKKIIAMLMGAFCAAVSFAAMSVSDNDAKNAAEQMFEKKGSFVETYKALYPKFEKFRKEQEAFVKKSKVDFGSWRQVRQKDGTYVFTRVIKSVKPLKVGVTLSLPMYSELYLNGQKLDENKGWNQTKEKVFTLDLQKGENILEMKTVKFERNFRYTQIFYPYASPIRKIREKFWQNYGHVMSALDGDKTAIFENPDLYKNTEERMRKVIEESLFSAGKFEKRYNEMVEKKVDPTSMEWLKIFEEAVKTCVAEREMGYDIKNVKAAVSEISKTYKAYPKKYLEEINKWEPEFNAIKEEFMAGNFSKKGRIEEFKKLADEALLANPALKKFKNWVFLKRAWGTPFEGLPSNWQGNPLLKNRNAWNDQIWSFDITKPNEAELLYSSKEETPAITDMEIDWDAKKLMFSGLDKKDRWQLYEIELDKKGAMPVAKMLTPGIHENVDSYDATYLPNGKIIFCYTACHVGVPCVSGSDYVANLYVMDPNAGSPEQVDKSIRQLTFEQDADWMPTVMNDGRVMYTRWEYTDNSHYFSRILMRMNPDGTSQASYYGSTSFWPNSIFYSRQIPNSSTKFMSIVSGHHGTRRSGELHLFDTSKGTFEDEGRVHKFPTYGREYVAKTKDTLVDGVWPQMLHPYPINEGLAVVSARTPQQGWSIYLVDKFDNMTMLQRSGQGWSYFEPMPVAKRKKPSVIPSLVEKNLKANPKLDTGTLFLNDIYQGPGLAGVPRGTVKALRIFEYNYAYRNMGAHDVIGQEGSWDVKRIHGTVPVEPDGSAIFEVPANRPIALQPLDKDGNALALMRSWLTVMPGEVQSCVGCHEANYMTPISATAMAARKKPSKITPFRGPVRGYSFVRDVQPILDKYCVGCHDGTNKDRPVLTRGNPVWKHFTSAYMALHPFVRRSGPESTQNLLPPSEFKANTSELVQMLKKGHHGVELDDDAWSVLYTWIDLNVPFIGSWKEVRKEIPNNGDVERKKFLALYANRFDDPDVIDWDPGKQEFVAPKPEKKHPQKEVKAAGFPFDEDVAKRKVAAVKLPKELVADLGDGQTMRFSLIPAGSFVMGTNDWYFDEGPARAVKVDKPFYMATFETTNAQYKVFDKNHNSAYFDRHWKDHVNRGYPANLPEQSVVRVSWKKAMQFCKWMSEKYGLEVSLPTETQWEWAARAGSDGDFWFGNIGADFSAYENLSDFSSKKFAVMGIDPQPIRNPSPQMAFVPADLDFNDGQLVTANVGSYAPSPFNLYDINGNVAEWALNDYTKNIGGEKVEGMKVARGGSWRDRSKWARVTVRRAYPDWQGVYNVGFRVVINDPQKAAEVLEKAAPLPKKPLKFGSTEENDVDLSQYKSSNPNEMIINGGFDYPVRDGGNVSSGDMIAWKTNKGSFEVWNTGDHGSPKLNSQGKETGRQIELAEGGVAPFDVWQMFRVPEGYSKAKGKLTFEAWPRKRMDTTVTVFVNAKRVASKKLEGRDGVWTKNSLDIPNLSSGQTVKVLFRENGNESLGWHIDDVSFILSK